MVNVDVTFVLGGADASGTLSPFVTLGSDIAGDESKVMITPGAGAVYPVCHRVILDLQYRFGRISTATAITVNRVGRGIGVTF